MLPVLLFLSLCSLGVARVINFETDLKAVAGDSSLATEWANGRLLNATLQTGLQPGDTLLIPNKTFHLMGGLQADGLKDITIQLDGTIVYSKNMKAWPRQGKSVLECLHLSNLQNVTFTSSGKGTFDGQGATWWGIPGVGYLQRQENRPRLFHLNNGKGTRILSDQEQETVSKPTTTCIEQASAILAVALRSSISPSPLPFFLHSFSNSFSIFSRPSFSSFFLPLVPHSSFFRCRGRKLAVPELPVLDLLGRWHGWAGSSLVRYQRPAG